MKLSICLSENREVLGPKWTNLGKKKGSHFWNTRKIMLSHDENEGWSIIKLNILQLLLRNYIGFYRSTQAKPLLKKLKNLLTVDSKKLHATLWIKKKLIGVGNAEFSQAAVICFAEQHTDKQFRYINTQIINENYQEGDVVLVEGVAYTKQTYSSSTGQSRNLKSNCVIYGWEPININELSGSSIAKHRQLNKEFEEYALKFRNIFPKKDDLTNDQVEKGRLLFQEFTEKFPHWCTYLGLKSLSLEILEKTFIELTEGAISQDTFMLVIAKTMKFFIEHLDEALYKNITPEQFQEILKDVDVRNEEGLCKAIPFHRKLERKVYIIAGATHILNHDAPFKRCDNVQKTLAEKKFIVITRKTMFEKIKKLNPSLKRFSL